MAERKSNTVVLDGKFVRREASDAVRTFFRPVVGAYHLVRDASNPDRGDRTSESSQTKPKGR
jgi:hypothetical protein